MQARNGRARVEQARTERWRNWRDVATRPVAVASQRSEDPSILGNGPRGTRMRASSQASDCDLSSGAGSMFEDALGSRSVRPGRVFRFSVGEYVDGQYLVVAHLGQGGMGAVLRVKDQWDREWALKYCDNDSFRLRFAREVRMMTNVQSQHVIQILGYNLDHVPPYFLMPLAQGSIEKALPSFSKHLPTALAVFDQVCVGVMDLHASKVFHRDLKPANILRIDSDRYVVSDLGLARFESRDTTILTNTIQHIGTEDFLAPEQRRPEGAASADARTDVYQLGKVLYSMVTGLPPAYLDFTKLPQGLDHIVRTATADDPARRYQAAKQLYRAVKSYRATLDVSHNPRGILANLIARLEQRSGGMPTNEALPSLIEALSHCCAQNESIVVKSVHQVPATWFGQLGRLFGSQMHPILVAYEKAVRATIGGADFSEAVSVGDRMGAIYENASNKDTRVVALTAMMVAADKLDRYSVQAKFSRYVKEIQSNDMAFPVAQAIMDYGRVSVESFRHMDPSMCHPEIRRAFEEVRAAEEDFIF